MAPCKTSGFARIISRETPIQGVSGWRCFHRPRWLPLVSDPSPSGDTAPGGRLL